MKITNLILLIYLQSFAFAACHQPKGTAAHPEKTLEQPKGGAVNTEKTLEQPKGATVTPAKATEQSKPLAVITDTSRKDTSRKDSSKASQDLISKAMQSMASSAGTGKAGDSSAKNNARIQKILGGTKGDPGNALGKMILNSQLGHMSNDNPLKLVSKNIMAAQENGTAGPTKTYTAEYRPEQPADYQVGISGIGKDVVLHYTGGNIENAKKNGLWKNISVILSASPEWNVLTEAYAESITLHMKVYSLTLARDSKPFNLSMNTQYKKFSKIADADRGKNESGVSITKIGNESLFGYPCVHIKVHYTIKALGSTAIFDEEDWYSNKVPGAERLSPHVYSNHSQAIISQIVATGCQGVLVKSITHSAGTSDLIQLSSITHKNLPANLFQLPAAFQEDKNIALYDIQ